jgi:flagellar hook assembly protein FlgD
MEFKKIFREFKRFNINLKKYFVRKYKYLNSLNIVKKVKKSRKLQLILLALLFIIIFSSGAAAYSKFFAHTSKDVNVVVTTAPDGTKKVIETTPDGKITITETTPDGTKKVVETKPDGTKKVVETKPDGSVIVIETKPDGKTTTTSTTPDGTTTTTQTQLIMLNSVELAGYPLNVKSPAVVVTILPAAATVNYKWQSATTANGVYSDISSAADYINYTPTVNDVGKFLRVVATGYGNYSGTVISQPIGPVEAYSISSVSLNTNFLYYTSVPSVISIEPYDATVNFQWQSSSSKDGPYNDINGANSSSYHLTPDEFHKFIRVVVSGYGAYGGVITKGIDFGVAATPITQLSPLSGELKVGSTLYSGAYTPSDATVTYRWSYSNSIMSNANWNVISSATQNSLNLTNEYVGMYIKLEVSGYGFYTQTIPVLSQGKIQP